MSEYHIAWHLFMMMIGQGARCTTLVEIGRSHATCYNRYTYSTHFRIILWQRNKGDLCTQQSRSDDKAHTGNERVVVLRAAPGNEAATDESRTHANIHRGGR